MLFRRHRKWWRWSGSPSSAAVFPCFSVSSLSSYSWSCGGLCDFCQLHNAKNTQTNQNLSVKPCVGEITTCVAKHLWKIWMLNFLRRNRISFLTKCYKLHQILICFIYYFTDSLNLIWTYLSWIYVWISRSPTYCL